jgi:hypothetical protein
MKMIRYVLIAAMFAMVTGCATTQAVTAENSDDGVIKQRTEFKDLSVEMQEAILYGS